MELFQVDTIDTAVEKLLACTENCFPRQEMVSFTKALGRILSEDIYSKEDIPGFDRSTVDGYAVCAKDTAGCSESVPVFLHDKGSILMGQDAAMSLTSGECAYVPTGGMLPKGADAMVMVEYTEPLGDMVAINDAVSSGRNVIWKGEDIRNGDLLFKKGRILRPADIGTLAALGITEVPVFAPFSMVVFSSGDEVVPPEAQPVAAQVRDINGWAVRAQALQNGILAVHGGIIPDDDEILRKTLDDAKNHYDMVVISGGSSQGKKDMTGRIFAEIASPGILTHGLAVKPGKPTLAAWDEESRTIFAGLPGHPVSAMMVFQSVFLAWWQISCGICADIPIPAQMEQNLAGAGGKQSLQPVRISRKDDGSYAAVPVFYRSGLITALTAADGFISIGRDQEGVKAGETVFVHLFR